MDRRNVAKSFGLGMTGAAFAGTAFAQNTPTRSRLGQIFERGSIRVGTTGDFNPMSFRDTAANELRGYDIEAMTQLAADSNLKIEWITTDWATLIAGVAANRYDIFAGGASINMARARTAAFTLPYTEAGTVPLSLKQNSARFDTWEKINAPDVRVAVTLGTVFDEQAKKHFPKAQLRAVQSPATGFQEVLAGRADVTITSNVEAASLIKRFEQLAIVAPGSDMRNLRPFGYVIAQDDPTWQSYLNTWIIVKKAEGFFESLGSKWLPKA